MYDEENGDWENSNKNLLMNHTQEQFLYRISLVAKNSPTCLNGECFCGCDTPSLFLADRACTGFEDSKGIIKKSCYDKMMNKQDWESFKIKNKIDVNDLFKITKKYLYE